MKSTTTLTVYIADHWYKRMEKALSAERYPFWKRPCPELKDTGFIRQGILPYISAVDSGGSFLQTMEKVQDERIPHSTYIK